MSAERYEITDAGTSIIIAESSGIRSTIDPVDGHHLDDAVIGAIRQQTRDLEIRNEWYANALNELDDKRSEITKLRAELAAAVASIEDDFSGWRAVERRWKTRAEQAEARLAAIDNAPTVAVVCSSHSFGQFVQQRFFGSQLPRIGTELIARPAKD